LKQLIKIVIPLIGKGGLIKYTFLGIFSGFCSFLFINSVTRVVGLILAGTYSSSDKEYMILFSLIILLFVWTRRTLSLGIVNISQTLFWRLRKQVLTVILNSNYQQLAAKRVEVQTAMLNDVYVLTDASLSIIAFFSALILAVSCLVYLWSISMVLFCITLFVALTGVAIYHFSSTRNMKQFQKARELENKFQGNFKAILDGFKEIYMEPKKGRYIYNERITEIANTSYRNNRNAYTGFINNQITGQILFYILISSILLFWGLTLKIKPADIVSFVFTLLYLLGSIETIMVLLPTIVRARVASSHLMELTKELEAAKYSNPIADKYIQKDEFDQIMVKGLEFYYSGQEEPFGVGPISIDINKGETIFIYGGNGSGKTTFVHAILGLRIPTGGEIWLNDILIDSENYPNYRTLFSVVFSDFYLFDEILAVDHVDMEKWNYYLHLFELQDKVTLDGKKLSTTELSTGQRKRLALITALLEDKPILVMDEWAADQDPHFRKKFYVEILPILKKDGFTIIAITHDERYYHCADRLFKMDYGKLIEEHISVSESPVII
jgi:putative ATP-binding cassette transporter